MTETSIILVGQKHFEQLLELNEGPIIILGLEDTSYDDFKEVYNNPIHRELKRLRQKYNRKIKRFDLLQEKYPEIDYKQRELLERRYKEESGRCRQQLI